MKFIETKVAGAYVFEVERRGDDRGFFGRAWCRDELGAHGLDDRIAQINLGYSAKRGTLRGMHFQTAPDEETKVVRCTAGRVYDVVLDLRPDSPTFRGWDAVELTADNRKTLYIPEGCAHGYQTLTDDSEIYYLTSRVYSPDRATGVRYDDPAFGIEWPIEVSTISDGDRNWPTFDTSGKAGEENSR